MEWLKEGCMMLTSCVPFRTAVSYSARFVSQVKAHKTHLVARSEYFRSMFRKGAMRESETSEVSLTSLFVVVVFFSQVNNSRRDAL